MITHFSNKAFLVTYEQSSGGLGCRKYVLAGIKNKRAAAETLMSEVAEKHKHDFHKIHDLKIQEVELNQEAAIFNYEY